MSFHDCPHPHILHLLKYSQEFSWPHIHLLFFPLDSLKSEQSEMGYSESESAPLVFQ